MTGSPRFVRWRRATAARRPGVCGFMCEMTGLAPATSPRRTGLPKRPIDVASNHKRILRLYSNAGLSVRKRIAAVERTPLGASDVVRVLEE